MIKFNIISFILFTLGFMTFWSNGSFDPNTKEFYVAICSGVFAATLSEFLMLKLFKKGLLFLPPYLERTIANEEKYKVSSLCSHKKGWERVGGKLFITNNELIFKSHKFNIQNHEQVFDLAKISDVFTPDSKRLSFEYMGKREKFILEEPEKWKRLLLKE